MIVNTSEWVSTLKQRLIAWAFLVASAGVAGSPATDMIGLGSQRGHVADVGTPAFLHASNANASQHFSMEDERVVKDNAQREAQMALRIIDALRKDVGSHEAGVYLEAVAGVLAGAEQMASIREVGWLAAGLRAARTRLLDEASSYSGWLRWAETIDPGGAHRVPARFVRHEILASSESWDLTLSESRVMDAVVDFAGEHADLGASRG